MDPIFSNFSSPWEQVAVFFFLPSPSLCSVTLFSRSLFSPLHHGSQLNSRNTLNRIQWGENLYWFLFQINFITSRRNTDSKESTPPCAVGNKKALLRRSSAGSRRGPACVVVHRILAFSSFLCILGSEMTLRLYVNMDS